MSSVGTVSGVKIRINDEPPVDGTAVVEIEQIDVTTMWKPDLTWEYIDANWHFHAYTADAKLPTLETKTRHVEVEPVDAEDDGWDYDVSYYVCRICGEEITPATVANAERKYATGRKSWEVVVPVGLPAAAVRSVRFEYGFRIYFGVAQVVHQQASSDGVLTTLVGIGELGERETRVTAGG